MTRQPRVFISRTTVELKDLAERIAEVLRKRGIEPIIQTGFYLSTHDLKGMLAEHFQQCDAVICLIATAYGSGPCDPISKAEQPVCGLKDPCTKDRLFSYTQLELLIARDLGRPIYTFFIEGDEFATSFALELPELAQRQQTFITEFAKDGRNTYGTFSQWDQPADPARGLKQAIEVIEFEITVYSKAAMSSSPKSTSTSPPKAPSSSKASAPSTAWAESARPAPRSNAWKHADAYKALLFLSSDTPEALHRNLAALCGPLVLNLPEQNEKEQAIRVQMIAAPRPPSQGG